MRGRGGAEGVPRLVPAYNLQEEGEDVDDVCVDGEGTVDVLLRAYCVLPVPQHKLGVIGKELGGQRVCEARTGVGGTCLTPLPTPAINSPG